MFSYQKNLALKQYQNLTFAHKLTSHFVYLNIGEVPRVRRLRLNIDTKKNKKVYLLYLFLLTGQIPYTRKFNPSWKNSNSHAFLKPKAATSRIQVCVRPGSKFKILSEIITKIIYGQPANETRIWRFQESRLLVFVPTARLTKNMANLQGKNSYFPNFSLILHFTLSNTTAFQKIFYLRNLKIIAAKQKIQGLDFLK